MTRGTPGNPCRATRHNTLLYKFLWFTFPSEPAPCLLVSLFMKPILVFALLITSTLCCLAEDLPLEALPPTPAPKPPPPIVKEGIRIYPAEGYLEVDARACLEAGIIELYASSPGGKLHESLLVLMAKPQLIHFGLIILGLKEGKACDVQGGAQAPRGEPVDLFVEWEEGGKTWRARGEDLIYNVHTKKRMEQGSWVFTGSRFVKDRNPNTGQERDIYLANATGTVITTFRDPSSILDNASEFGADDTSYVVNEALAAMGRLVLAEIRDRMEAAPDDAARAPLMNLYGAVKQAMHTPPAPAPHAPETPPQPPQP